MNLVTVKRALESFAVVEDCLFEVFSPSTENGGAISASDITSCILKHLLFSSCAADHGGAVAINNSLVFLHASCFSNCNARVCYEENGGNAFFVYNCTLTADVIAAFRCAPSTATCGDGVFQIRLSDVHSAHTNFSSCAGKSGDCSFSSIDVNNSFVSYMNVIDCDEGSLYCLPRSSIKYSNFIRNKVYAFLIRGNYGGIVINNSYFFGNTNKQDGDNDEKSKNVEYHNCYGDIIRTGVDDISEIKTCQQTIINYQRCKNMCWKSELHHAHSKCFVVIIEFLNCI